MKKIAILTALIIVFTVFSCEREPSTGPFRIWYYAFGDDVFGVVPTDPNIYTTGEEAIVLGRNSLSKANHTFTGWNTEQDGSGTAYSEGDTITIEHSTIFLHAQWVPSVSQTD